VSPEHDLFTYMRQFTDELGSEYGRIRARGAEDPGTAGDQGEENWAELLREWLPSSYTVVTKGRLLAHDGSTSRQLDVLVLDPSYPPFLRGKNYYMLGGVAAVFECKTTLRSAHIGDAMGRCKEVKALAQSRVRSTPVSELRGGIMYGLLAHSHEWQQPSSQPKTNIHNALQEGIDALEHPRDMPDIVCVADVGAWHSSAMISTASIFGEHWDTMMATNGYPAEGAVTAIMFEEEQLSDEELPDPVGVALATIYERLGQADPSLRGIADYVRLAGLYGSGRGLTSNWPLTIFSDEVRTGILQGRIGASGDFWSEWRHLMF
jgi:hypothetical protein